MRVAFDTNILVRLLLSDDAEQAGKTSAIIASADKIYVSIVVLCELVWVARSSFRISRADIADRIESLAADERVVCDSVLTAAGLAFLRQGGDFADAVIAADGRRMGAARFATFDKQAARLLEAQGVAVTLLG